MNIKRHLLLLIAIPIMQVHAITGFDGNERSKYNFNSGWKMHVGDDTGGASNFNQTGFRENGWKNVTLPRAFNEDEAFKVAIDEHTDTVMWYRKHFKLPTSAKNHKIFLEFEGIRFGGDFWVNGKHVSKHENGVMAFGIDITDYVQVGKDNVISARIDNSWRYKEQATGSGYQWNDKNFNANYGGIPKNVFLHITPKLYQTLPLYSNLKTTGTYVYAREINISRKQAQICVETEVKNEFQKDMQASLEVVVEDMNGVVVKKFSSAQNLIKAGSQTVLKVGNVVDNLHFWSWGYGYLYNVYAALVVNNKPIDVVKVRTGFRKTAFRDGMVYLNDRVLQMKGYAQRTSNEWPAVGMSVPAWVSDYSNKLMVESNANLVRWMHVTPWKQDVESCDRVGLMQAMPAGDAEKDVTGRRWELRTELMRDAIIYNRNNPSILFFESGNDNISEEHMSEMKAIRDKFDPFGGRAIGSREMLDSKIAEYGGEMLYVNKSAHIPMWATEYCRDEALRKYWDETSYPYHINGEGSKYYRSTVTNELVQKADATDYNRNQDTFFRTTIERWYDYFRVRPGTGKRVSSGGTNIIFSDSNTHFRGAENYRRSGEVDAMRITKDAYYAHQVMWNGWVDIEKDGTYICGHWQQPYDAPKDGKSAQAKTTKDVQVVSTGEKVELLVNGKSQGFGQREFNFLFTFKDLKYQPGTLEAISYNASGSVISRAQKVTVGEPQSISLKLLQAPDGFKADGADLAIVEIEVVDKDGRRCPLANNMIAFDLQGAAEWKGGIAKGKEGNYILDKNLPVECGVNRVLIRSTQKSGTVRLTASTDGLPKAELVFQSKTVPSKDGLSEYISGDHMPSNVSRGETPTGSSFKITRTPVAIVGAMAGDNEGDARLSFDDNELTEWSAFGSTKDAWISYELERDALVNEVELKMLGWRNKSYPIRISVDGKVVFEGETAKSLGYISIPVKPTLGRFVKIELVGQVKNADAFGGLIEVTGKKEINNGEKAAKGKLQIVEAEIYEALKN